MKGKTKDNKMSSSGILKQSNTGDGQFGNNTLLNVLDIIVVKNNLFAECSGYVVKGGHGSAKFTPITFM